MCECECDSLERDGGPIEPNRHISLLEMMICMAYLLSVVVIDKDVVVCCILFRDLVAVKCEFTRTKLV